MVLIAILSVSAVSAGLFDFGSDDSSQGKHYKVEGDVLKGTYVYKITGVADTRDSPGVTLTEDDFQYSMNGTGTLKINITNATDEELDNISKTIEGCDFENDDEDFYLEFIYKFNGTDTIYGPNIKSMSLNDTVLTVNFTNVQNIPEKAESGSAEITGGELRWGSSENGFTISFWSD